MVYGIMTMKLSSTAEEKGCLKNLTNGSVKQVTLGGKHLNKKRVIVSHLLIAPFANVKVISANSSELIRRRFLITRLIGYSAV